MRRLPESPSPPLMASDSVETTDVASKMTQWSPQPARVAADEQLYLHTLVSHDHTYSIISSDSIPALKFKVQQIGEEYQNSITNKRASIRQLHDSVRRKVAKLNATTDFQLQHQLQCDH